MIGAIVSLFYSLNICERRRYIRVFIKVPIKLLFNNKKIVDGVINNISAGGAFIKTKIPLPQCAEFIAFFRIPGCELKEMICGHVVWQKPVKKGFASGIEFTKISENDRDEIIKYNFEKHLG